MTRPADLHDPDRVRRTWVCETCGLRFLTDAVPFIRCVKLHHCHCGDMIACDDGTAQYAVRERDCEVIAVISFE